MNPVQEAVLNVLGVNAELKAQETAWNEEKEEILSSLEQVDGQNKLLIRQIEDLDYLNLYDVQNIVEIIPTATRAQTINKLRRLRHENPMAKQSIQLIKRFTLGKGVQWTTANDQIKQVINEFWFDEENQMILTTHEAQKELLDDIVVDGERFLGAFTVESTAPYVKLAEIPTEEVKQIIYDPNNRKIPVWYKRVFVKQTYDGKSEQYTPDTSTPDTLYYLDHRISDDRLKTIKGLTIPAKKIAKDDKGNTVRIFHFYINPLRGKAGVRGVSELFASREWFRVFKEFMEDRAAINSAATAVAWRRKIKGGPTEVAQFHNKLGGLDVGYDQSNVIRRLTKPVGAAVYDSNPAVDLEWMKTDTGATQAKEDARMLLTAAGAGVAINIHYFGEGGDANLATAQAMELPMVKTFEDWQTFFREAVLQEIIAFVLKTAFPKGVKQVNSSAPAQEAGGSVEPGSDAPEPPSPEADIKRPETLVAWSFPPIISKDIVKVMTAISSLVTQIAKGNSVVEMAAIRQALAALEIPNINQILKEVEAEQKQIQADAKKLKDANLKNLQDGGGPPQPGQPGDSQNGKTPVTGFPNANAGLDAGTKRIAAGKPPIDHSS